MSDFYLDVATMFAAHGITGHETPFAHDGYSGATMTRIEQESERYVVKRASRTADWVIQMTSDHALREAQIGASHVLEALAPGLRSPSIAAARDGDGFALLMHDLTPYLLPTDGIIAAQAFELVFARVAAMHALFWNAPPRDDLGWCGVRERLLFLSEPNGERLRAAGMMEMGFAAGWERFHAAVPREVSVLMRELHREPSPLLSVLAALPQTLLHNDVKTANIAIEDDTLWLFDWQLTGIGAVAVELAWLLAGNSSRLPWPLDETLARYAEHLRGELRDRFEDVQWERQRAASHICGLVMFGWAKGGDELDWWCERALEAKTLLDL